MAKTLGSLLLFLFAASCGSLPGREQSGTFNVHFTWTTPPPSFDGWAYMRVESRPGDPNVSGTTVGTSGPTQFQAGLGMNVGSIPNQDNLVVVVELRDIASLDGQVLYYGLSDKFALKAGHTIDVNVAFAIVATPAAATPSDGNSVLRVVSANNSGIVNNPNCQLLLFNDRGATLRLSNTLGLPAAGTQTFTVASLAPGGPAPTGFTAYSVPWSLAFGGVDLTCAAPSGCGRTVYGQVVDLNGYASLTATADIILDTQAPGLQTNATLVSPTQASASSLVVVNVVPNETLAAPPTLRVGGQTNLFNLVTQEGNTTFAFVSQAPAGVQWTDGVYTVLADMTDVAGNTVQNLEIGSFTVDSTLPGVVDANTLVTPVALMNGDTLTISFTVSKALAQAPQVRVGTDSVSNCQPVSSGSLSYTCSQLVTSAASEGTKPVSVQLVDGANNLNTVILATVQYDFTPPAISLAFAAPTYVASGGNVVLTLVFDEPLSAVPPLTVNTTFGTPPVFTYIPSSSTTEYDFATQQTGGSNRVVTVTTVATDLAGNVSGTLAAGGYTYDTSPPNFNAGIVTTPTTITSVDVAAGTQVHTTFSLFEVPHAGYPQVVLNSTTLVPCTASGMGLDFNCTYTASNVSGGDGPKTLTVTIYDQAGNGGVMGTSTVYYYLTLPVGTLSVYPGNATAGDVLTVQLISSNALGHNPNFTVTLPDGSNGASLFTLYAPGSVTYTWTRTILSSDPSGTWAINVDNIVDVFNNPGHAVSGQVTVSQAAPAVVASNVTPLLVKAGVGVTATFTTSNAPASTYPRLRIGDAQVSVSPTGNPNEYSGTLASLQGSDGVHEVLVLLGDAAGNTRSTSLAPVTLDTTLAAGTLDVAPFVVPANATIIVQYAASEPLAAAPSLAVTLPNSSSGSALFGNATQVGWVYTWTYVLQASDPDGTWDFSVSAIQDLAGNVAGPVTATTQVDHSAMFLREMP